ncbi:MAG: amidohydrolase family protein [bacterium]
MKSRKFVHIFVIVGSILALCAVNTFGQTGEVIVRGGWLFDGTGNEVVKNNAIVVRGGKFMEVNIELAGRDISGAQVIELGENDYILPGFFDLHAHYNVNLIGKGRKDETKVNPVIYLANGVTSTFPAGEYNPEDMLELRRRIDRGEQIGPRLFNAGPYYGTARRGWFQDSSRQQIYATVDKWAELGARGFKAKGISPGQLQALIERAHWHGLTVTGHLGSGFRNSVNPRDAILMGIDRIEHFLGGDAITADKRAYASLQNLDPDAPEVDEIIQLYIKHNVYFDATLTAYGYYGERKEGYDYWVDEKKFLSPYVLEYQKDHSPRRTLAQFEKIYWIKRRTIKKFYDAGGGYLITLGTDHPSTGEFIPGFSAHRELEAFVLSGIPPAAALKIATINGARALDVGNKLGSIEPGKFADLMVIKGNPLDNIRNTRTVHLVMKSGKVYNSQALLKSVEGKMGPLDAAEAEKL